MLLKGVAIFFNHLFFLHPENKQSERSYFPHLSAQTRTALDGLVKLRHRVGRRRGVGEFRLVVVPRGRRGCDQNLPVQSYLVLLLYMSVVEFHLLSDIKHWLHLEVKRRRR